MVDFLSFRRSLNGLGPTAVTLSIDTSFYKVLVIISIDVIKYATM